MMLRNVSHRQSVMLLVLTTLIWGTTFPLLKDVVTTLSPSALMSSRFLIAALAFVPFCRKLNRKLVRDGVILGTLLFIGFATQVIGLETTSANRAAFITSLNVILVPLLGSSVGRSVSKRVLLSAGLAIAGIGVMSWEGGLLSIGDLWVFACAISYAVYILVLEAVATQHTSLTLTALQLIVVAVLGAIWGASELVGQIREIGANFGVLLYLGLIGTAIAIWTQAVAQRQISATETAIIYTLEPVFAAVFSFWLLGETLGLRGLLGACMVLSAMILSQLRK